VVKHFTLEKQLKFMYIETIIIQGKLLGIPASLIIPFSILLTKVHCPTKNIAQTVP
jgi:hypothetical protein